MFPPLILQDGLTRLTLLPARGASLADWRLLGSDTPLLRPFAGSLETATSARQLGGFPLLPWSNRITGDGYALEHGWQALQPQPGEALPIHGSAWHQPWQVVEQQAQRARLRLDSAIPFAYRAELLIALDDGCLQLTLRVEHRDPTPNWYGLGLHPYFPRRADTQLRLTAGDVWLPTPGELRSAPQPIPPAWRFDTGAALPPDQVDHAFGGWDGRCEILEPQAGYRLSCQAEGADYALLFCPAGRDFFCVEPVSHPINAHHLPQRPGLRRLAQGDTATLRWTMHCQRL